MKTVLKKIRSCKPEKKYIIRLNFEDNTYKLIDLAPFLKQCEHLDLVHRLRNPDNFKKVKLVDGVLSWYGGKVDINPYTISQYFIS